MNTSNNTYKKKQQIVGLLETNCYILYTTKGGEAFIIDPGGNADTILRHVADLNLTVTLIVNTHGHIDHIAGNKEIKEATSSPIALHSLDAPLIRNGDINGATMLGLDYEPVSPDKILSDGDILTLGDFEFSVIHTPGHSPGGICLYDGERALFCGDLLFNYGVGRWDLPGGDRHELAQSLKKIMALPVETHVFPGHGSPTTIAAEKDHNPYLLELLGEV